MFMDIGMGPYLSILSKILVNSLLTHVILLF